MSTVFCGGFHNFEEFMVEMLPSLLNSATSESFDGSRVVSVEPEVASWLFDLALCEIGTWRKIGRNISPLNRPAIESIELLKEDENVITLIVRAEEDDNPIVIYEETFARIGRKIYKIGSPLNA